MSVRYDVVVVGSGAAGGWAAMQLTQGGAHVALVEAGPRLDLAADFNRLTAQAHGRSWPSLAAAAADRLALHLRRRLGVDRQPLQSQTPGFTSAMRHYYVDDVDHPYETTPGTRFDWLRGRSVGGRTNLWWPGRVALRMSDRQFKAATHDGHGTDWPIGYADLEPHYSKVERALEISGRADGEEQVPDGACATDFGLSERLEQFKRTVSERWPDRRAIPFRWAPLKRGGSLRFSSVTTTIKHAQATGRLDLHSDSIVDRVLVDPGTSVATGVSVIDRGRGAGRQVLGKYVMLCASALESTRILLHTTDARHPGGLGASSGALGRYLMDHVAGVRVIGLRRAAAAESPSRSDSIYVFSFNPTPQETGFVRDYAAHCTLGCPVTAQGVVGMKLPWSALAGRHMMAVMAAYGESLADRNNRVTLSADRVDAWGIPVPRIHYRPPDNDRRMAAHQVASLTELMIAAGYEVVRVEDRILPGRAIHEMGTARMGSSPDSSVVDANNECWEVRNLFVTDAACFVSSGFQPPTLTIMAITARACDHVLERLRSP